MILVSGLPHGGSESTQSFRARSGSTEKKSFGAASEWTTSQVTEVVTVAEDTASPTAVAKKKEKDAVISASAQSPEDGGIQEKAEHLWRKFFADPTQWKDNRHDKKNSKGPDFKHSATGEGLWIDNRFKPAWLQGELNLLRDGKAGSGRELWTAGVAGSGKSSFMKEVSVEGLWQKYFKNPTEWWDNRNSKLHPRSPDFRHKVTKQALCIDSFNTPKWVTEALKMKTSIIGTGGDSGTTLYGECRSGDSIDLKVPQRDLFAWTRLISHLNKSGQSGQALKTYEEMQKSGLKPSSYTFVAALKACGSLHDLERAKRIHSEVVESGLESDVYVCTMLVDAYVKCKSLVDAKTVFEKMTHRDVVSWTAMIFGYAQMEEGELALQLYTKMRQEGLVPDPRAFVGALKACSSLTTSEEGNRRDLTQRCLQQVRTIHADIINSGCESALFVGNMLVDVYCKCGSMGDARNVFDKMPRRDVVSWNAIILGYAQMEESEEALHLYARMQQEGVVPDDRTYTAALKACSSMAEGEHGNQADGVLMKGRCIEQVRAIHSQVVKRGPKLAVFVGTMLVDVYAKCGNLLDARHVFDKMPHRDVVSWNAMILGYARLEFGGVALELYIRMQKEGVVPDDLTMVAALKACGSVAALETGMEIHSQVSKTGREATDLFLASSLIDMYGKCGSMVDAQKVFDGLLTKGIVAWNALIAGYARQGESDLVFDAFERMKQGGLQPEAITFVSVLNVCSHTGLIDKGQKYFESMRSDFGISPTIEHYSCMVDLLGRSGQVENAVAMVKTMPVQPDAAIWRTVLGACRKWRKVELGRQAFESALNLDNEDAAAYVLMCNIYAAAHMHKDAKEVHTMRMKTRAWKKPGQSWWTDMSGVVHVFAVGDREHPESVDIHSKVEDLLVTMKGAGYVPHLDSVLRDIPDGEKEDALCGHSEKLAISYALLKTPQGTTIRVVKNLRMCEDCHIVTALISKIEQRTIICRDTRRFHLFKSGKCSCGDYW